MHSKLSNLFLFSTWVTGSDQQAEKLLKMVLDNVDLKKFSHLSCNQKLHYIYNFYCKEALLFPGIHYQSSKTSDKSIVTLIATLPVNSRVVLGLQSVLEKSIDEIAFITQQDRDEVQNYLISSRVLLMESYP
ncbi:hypothetical protein [Vibrio cyclitrophicus]|uniref:hypothetical protein n=1 Tax=Vibrio cyclitrophicus TaxID=47951 RepID=UPI000299E60E|nr:hypothetical protein [Vibrio cyclitrophicus]OEE24291.1 hypothetical protein OAM_17135 [Vibrio cyclitrophicus ZF14]